MIDEDLSAAMALYGRAKQAWEKGPGVWPSVAVRFLTACDSPRKVELLARVEELISEAKRLPDPDPEGPTIQPYSDALLEWVASHPEIEPTAFEWLTTERQYFLQEVTGRGLDR